MHHVDITEQEYQFQVHATMENSCFVCIDLDVDTQGSCWQRRQPGLGYQRIVNYIDLCKTATRGCKLCSIIFEGIKAFQYTLGYIGEEAEVFLRCNLPLFPLVVGIAENKWAAARWLEFFTLADQPAPWRAFGPANLVPEKLDVDIATRQARQWLNECDANHKCSVYHRSRTQLPTRVLDLGEDPSPQDSIKLLETEEAEGIYMTLSHCWGPTQFITTTRDTLKQRVAGIALSDLSKTFKDAISLTRKLKIRYLWIDSLCIIQKDKEDWEREAGKMGSVYSQSFLNIAATSSAEGSGGLFKERLVLFGGVPSTFAIKSHLITGEYSESSRIYVRPSLNSAHFSLARKGSLEFSSMSPLLSRAWVYQERVLAPRTIHFHGTEMLWECISSSRCECGSLDREKPEVFRPSMLSKSDPSDVEQWCSVVQQYSGLNVTYPLDKLPALSGIAEHFQEKLKCDYMAGLWSNHLLRGLQWAVADGNKACRKLPYRAPTWSWASLDRLTSNTDRHYGVRVTYALPEPIIRDQNLSVVSARVQTDGENPYGVLKEGGELILKGAFMLPWKAEVKTEPVYPDGTETILILHFEGVQKGIRVQPDVVITSTPLNDHEQLFDARELRWLVFGEAYKRQYGLLLRLRKGHKDVYERLGMPSAPLSLFDLKKKLEVAEFKIV